jgi:hypothetical protein
MSQAVSNVAAGAVVGATQAVVDGATSTGSAAAGILRIDPAQVDGAITVFRNALTAVEDQVAIASAEIRALPPANDAVSTDIANAFNRVGYENPDSAIAAWTGAIEQLRSIIEQLEASKQTDVNADTSNSGFLRQQ